MVAGYRTSNAIQQSTDATDAISSEGTRTKTFFAAVSQTATRVRTDVSRTVRVGLVESQNTGQINMFTHFVQVK